MMADKVRESTNEKMFELLKYNRNVTKIEPLLKSMRKYGWISAYPMNVIANGNGKFLIKDGHHRFEAAQRLGIPFKYIVCRDDSTIYELDGSTNKWDLRDCLESYCRGGNIEYSRLRDYCGRTGIAPLAAMAMLGGQTAGTNNFRVRFREGTYRTGDTTNANIVADIVLHCKSKGIEWASTNNLVIALSRVVWVAGFSATRLKSKISAFPFMVEKKPHVEGYLEMIEAIYNRQARSKIPLKFLSDKAAKERNAAVSQ